MGIIDKNRLLTEIKFRSSRSSGPGGQSVNKISTKVSLLFDVRASVVLLDEQKIVISEKHKNRINSEGILQLSSDETRSQLKNKEILIKRFLQLLEESLTPKKKRKSTKPGWGAKEKRLKTKKIKSDKKDLRKPPEV